jgi:glycosyltransferase involved in cell wall biosynthesis
MIDAGMSSPTIAVMFSRLGPYHHARLAALKRVANVTAIEVDSEEPTYGWRADDSERPYPIVRLFAGGHTHNAPGAKARVRDVLDAIGPDVMCIPGWASVSALAALDWCLANGVPAILLSDSAAADARRSPLRELPKSLIVRMYSAAVVAGASHAAYVHALGMPQRLIFTGYDVVDNRYFAQAAAGVRADAAAVRSKFGLPDKYFLASARFVRKKNVPGLLKAYAAYLGGKPAAPWSLVLLGDGELAPEIDKKIVEYGLADRVILPGFRQYDELPVYYGLASALVHASTTEQWGLVVNEAMASGLPVIVSERCGCAQDLVENGVTGFTFDPDDTSALANLMARVAGGAVDVERMGRAARERIAAWSPERFAESVLAAARAAEPVRLAGVLRPALRATAALRGREVRKERLSPAG